MAGLEILGVVCLVLFVLMVAGGTITVDGSFHVGRKSRERRSRGSCRDDES